jgi:hypothetical protein
MQLFCIIPSFSAIKGLILYCLIGPAIYADRHARTAAEEGSNYIALAENNCIQII